MKKAATWANLAFATLVVVGVPLQVYFIASSVSGAGKTALDLHEGTGGIIHLAEVLVFLTGLAAFWGNWKWVGWCFLLPVLGTVQIGFAGNDPDKGWVHGIHGLGALLVFLLAAFIAHHDLRVLGLKGGAGTHSTPAAPPPA